MPEPIFRPMATNSKRGRWRDLPVGEVGKTVNFWSGREIGGSFGVDRDNPDAFTGLVGSLLARGVNHSMCWLNTVDNPYWRINDCFVF